MSTAWEDTVNDEFVKRVGQYLADMADAGEEMQELFDRLCTDYESTIDNLPEPSQREADENV